MELVGVDVQQQLPRPPEDAALVPPLAIGGGTVVLQTQIPQRLCAPGTEGHGAGRNRGRVGLPVVRH
eukprot:10316643-Alexandrium_andersonii.AAC.1